MRSAGTVSKFSLGGELRVRALCGGGELGICFRFSIEEHLEELASEYGAQDPAGIAVGEDDRARVVVRKPDHIAVMAEQIAAMMDDRDAVGGVDHQAHAISLIFADRHLRIVQTTAGGRRRDWLRISARILGPRFRLRSSRGDYEI